MGVAEFHTKSLGQLDKGTAMQSVQCSKLQSSGHQWWPNLAFGQPEFRA